MEHKWRTLSDSPNFKGGAFVNLSPTPTMAPGVSFRKIFYEMFTRPSTVKPSSPLPSVHTDLKALGSDDLEIIWFGHSSYLICCKGINILLDPVFSGHASPIPTMVKAFPGADVYKAADMPPIDILIISHNHYDHLDKTTIQKLAPQTKTFVTSLGVGKDLAAFGANADTITELDWWETTQSMPGIEITATPARHFSGRGLKRGGSLWSSFVLKLFGHTIYLGADSGYDTHFKAIGEKFGPFELAILECGQYNKNWPYIHMMPEETVQAAIDLGAEALLPVHWGKFTLANHPWNEPIQRVTKAGAERNLEVITPMIGERTTLHKYHPGTRWWEV